MDFKNILEEWKNYQRNKLVMANRFRCIVAFPPVLNIEGVLHYKGSGENRYLKCVDDRNGITWKLALSDILGTNPEGLVITFTLTRNRTVLVSFSTEAEQIAAHQAFLTFEGEESGPTPLGSSNSSSSSSASD